MPTGPEFSRLISIEGIQPDRQRTETIEATPEESARLAERLGLRELSNFRARLGILRVSEGKIVRVEGDIEAEVVQACVVSLRDVPARIKAHIETYFTEDGKDYETDPEFSLEQEEETSDVMKEGMLDLGELAAQYLSLELEPYPRAPGVSLAAQMAEIGTESKNRPFQVLRGLKKEEKE